MGSWVLPLGMDCCITVLLDVCLLFCYTEEAMALLVFRFAINRFEIANGASVIEMERVSSFKRDG